jgi:hypothetical protein
LNQHGPAQHLLPATAASVSIPTGEHDPRDGLGTGGRGRAAGGALPQEGEVGGRQSGAIDQQINAGEFKPPGRAPLTVAAGGETPQARPCGTRRPAWLESGVEGEVQRAGRNESMSIELRRPGGLSPTSAARSGTGGT